MGGSRLRAAAVLVGAASLALGCASTPPAPTYRVTADCQGSVADGHYEAIGPGGDRIEGRYCSGERCGVFTFYSGPDLRVAELPYESRVLNGTARVWYLPYTAIDSPHKRKSEAAFVDGRRQGDTRTWWPNGKRRTDFAYRQGVLTGGTAWSLEGEELPPDEALALARQDAEADNRLFRALGSIIGTYPPHCPP